MSSPTVLITGGAGFIGSSLGEQLIGKGTNVICLDNFDNFYPRQDKESNLIALKSSPQFKLIEGDIRDRKLLESVMHDFGVNMVIHLAAKAGVRPSITDPISYFDVNITGTANLLDEMRKAGINKLVYASSSSVYGNNEKIPYSETDLVDNPISPYAASKKAGELVTHTFHQLYGLDVINLRFFTVYGPKQRPDLAIHRFFKAIYSGLPIDVYGDGSTSRDYTFIEDIVAGIQSAMHYLEANNHVYEIINLGNSNPITLNELISLIETATGRQFTRNQMPMQQGDVNRTFADIRKAGDLLQYHPSTPIQAGILRFKNWYESYRKVQ